MPGQSDSSAQSSSASASQIFSSSSGSSAINSSDRATVPADSSSSLSSCNVLSQPTETSSSEASSRSHREDMAGREELSVVSTIANSLEQSEQSLETVDHVAPPVGDSDEALMAVPHYPEATNGSNFSVAEVVNAVIEQGDFFRHQNTPNREIPGSRIPPVELYMSDSEMTDALSELGGVSLDSYQLGQMEMAEFVNRFVDGTTAQDHYSAVSEATEEDSATDMVMEYEDDETGHRPISFSRLEEDDDGDDNDDNDDDRRKFDQEHGDSDEDDGLHRTSADDGPSHLSDIDFDDFYRGFDTTQVSGYGPPSSHEDRLNFLSDPDDANGGDPATDLHFPESVIHGTTQERNFTIDQFISQWLYHSSTASVPILSLVPPAIPQNPLSNIIRWTPPAKVTRPSGYTGDFYDLQQIPWWEKLRVKRADARRLRDQWYTSYHNLHYARQRPSARLSEEEFYFQAKSMYTECKATIEHFQLRNLMSVPAYNTIHFAHESKLYSWVPAYNDLQCLIDLSAPAVESGFQGPVKISTMKSAQGISIAGGFFGEYGLRASGTEGEGVKGFVTKDPNGITNHIDIVPSRTNRSPVGIFASNDRHIRVLDCETNTFLADHEFAHAINCTCTSPDGRLRVVIGDSPDAWVVEADTGRPVHPLRGHRDFGFACAWSPDMRQIVTSNQDKTAIIWDTRTWRMLQKIESDVAGYRSLRFSPVGGGPRTLLLCEPADRVVIVNAQTYQTRQVHDFFGEIGGAEYSPDGGTIWVANTDEHFGGFMEYDRRQWGQPYGPPQLPNEWVKESDLDEDERCLLGERERQLRYLCNLSDEEHGELLVY